MAYPHYRSQFGDTTFTKVFVGGLAWETPTEEMRRYFEEFGEILEAVIITDKITGKSKGYGFVTFRDPESARRACADPNPVIGGRRANCNIASLGRPRPSPPRGGRPQGGNQYQGSAPPGAQPLVHRGGATPLPPPPPPPHVLYPHYGYPPYTPDYGYHQVVYNPQVQQPQFFQQQVYGSSSSSSSSSTVPSPYYFGYNWQVPSARGQMSAAQGLRLPAGPYYLYYPGSPEGSFSTFPPQPLQPTTRHPFPASSSDSQTQQQTTTGTESGGVTSESPTT